MVMPAKGARLSAALARLAATEVFMKEFPSFSHGMARNEKPLRRSSEYRELLSPLSLSSQSLSAPPRCGCGVSKQRLLRHPCLQLPFTFSFSTAQAHQL